MGPVLRALGGGEVTLTLRKEDFNVVQVMSPDGAPMSAPARTLIVIQARSYRELRSDDVDFPLTDIWELRVPEETKAGIVLALVFVHGEDILCVKAASKVALG
jgi:Fe-S cluster assembly ATPase SufC